MANMITTVECECGRAYTVETGEGGWGRWLSNQAGTEFVDGQEAPVLMCECGRAMDYRGEMSEAIEAIQAVTAIRERLAELSDEELAEVRATLQNDEDKDGVQYEELLRSEIEKVMKRRQGKKD